MYMDGDGNSDSCGTTISNLQKKKEKDEEEKRWTNQISIWLFFSFAVESIYNIVRPSLISTFEAKDSHNTQPTN